MQEVAESAVGMGCLLVIRCRRPNAEMLRRRDTAGPRREPQQRNGKRQRRLAQVTWWLGIFILR